jgi:TetR/AcrR family transcriptional regulator, tetracycline repressor protein
MSRSSERQSDKASRALSQKESAGDQPKKRSPGRPKLPLDRIIDAAIEIIDAQGADALSMRSIAQHMDSGTATLYRHFSGRTELIGLVIDRIMAEGVPDVSGDASTEWQSTIASSARLIYASLRRHKGLASLLVDAMPEGPHSMQLRDKLIGTLLANGFSAAVAARAYATIARFVLGFAIQFGPSPGVQVGQSGALSPDAIDREKYPSLHAAAGQLPISLDEEFEFGLQLLMAGLSSSRVVGAIPEHKQQ